MPNPWHANGHDSRSSGLKASSLIDFARTHSEWMPEVVLKSPVHKLPALEKYAHGVAQTLADRLSKATAPKSK